MESKTYRCLEDYVMYDGRTAFIEGKEYSFVENIGKSEIHDIHDMQDETEFYRYFKQIHEPTLTNETPIQSPDADNTERGGRPSIKDYFPESFGVMDILPIYESQPELFNYAKALDRYIDDIENPTPPTLLNELRENADKQAIEFAEWLDANDWFRMPTGKWIDLNLKPKDRVYHTSAELLELFKQSKTK